MRAGVPLIMTLLCALPAPAFAAPVTQAFDARIAAAKAAMMTTPGEAFHQATLAEQAAASLPAGHDVDVARASAGWLKGEALVRLKRPEEAASLTNASLVLAERAAPGTKLVADLYRARGNLQASLGHVELAFRDFQHAHEIYRQSNEPRGQAMALQNIGTLYSNAGDDERVLYYYAQSAEAYSGDPMLTLSAYNNRAGALKKLGRLDQALAQYRAALGLARKLGSIPLQVRVLTNLADAQVLAGQSSAAEETIARALAIAEGPAAEARPFLYGVRAKVAFLRGDMPAAAGMIDRTFAGADLTKTPADFRDFHETAYRIYLKLGDEARALAHLEAFKRLDDQTRALTTSTSAALAAANFDFANQNLRIAKLKAGEIARDAMIAKGRARLGAIILMSALAVAAVAFVLLAIGLYQSRRHRKQVEAANVRLSTANTALETALTAKTQFLATTSHEIRTPLNGILGMTEVILSDRALDAALRDRLEVIHGAGKTMRALVDDILDVAKMEHGEMTLAPSNVALPAMLTEIGQLWESQARAKGVAVILDLDECPPLVFEDEARLRQTIFNLMSNAIKFTDAGSVRLSVRQVDAPEPRWTLTISDTGVGIPADKLEQIFESFSQVDGATTRRFGGTGLGLAIVRNLARAMGGDVTVTSQLDAGSAFELTLPLREGTAVPSTDDVEPSAHRETLAQAAVLVVERNPLTCGILTAILGSRVGSIDFAASVEEAEGWHMGVDHLVIDMTPLGEEAALPAIRSLRAAMPHASLTLLAAELSADEQRGLLLAGVERVLTKPVAPQMLLETLEQAHLMQRNLHFAELARSDAA